MNKILIPSLDPAFRAYLTRCSTLPSGAAYNALNHLFKNLRADGNLTKLDYLRMQCQDVQANAPLNIIANQFNASEVGSPTWTSGQGYTGNGSSTYLNTNYNPATQGSNFTLNGGCIGAYLLSNTVDGNNIIATSNGTVFNVLNPLNGGSIFGILNNNGSGTLSVASDDNTTKGLFVAVRTNSTTVQIWHNGNLLGSITQNSSAIPSLNLFELARNTNGTAGLFSTNTIAFSFAGSGTIDQLALYKSIQIAARTMGCAV